MAATFVQIPADLDDPFHPTIRWVSLPRAAPAALAGYLDALARAGCPACEHSPHPPAARLDDLRAMPYSEYLRSAEWHRTRRAKLVQAGRRCRLCGDDRNLHVHHLTYDHVGHEWLDELVVLCKDCHRDVHDDRDRQRTRRRR